jgi:predicted AAA+ superfamily ATPase
MINRYLKDLSKDIFFFGPRGTGKSTWVADQYPNALRVDLLDDAVFREYSANPNRLLSVVRGTSAQGIVIIDEVQKLPPLLTLVHLLIEENKRRTFVLTGFSPRK